MNKKVCLSENKTELVLKFLKYLGSDFMNIKAITTGLTAGAAMGFACYAFASSGARKRHNIKKHAGKTLKAAGSLLDDITSIMS